ncbi:MAG: hydrogenase maturation nickel metallochaperone HypA [Cytophagaceae bacterium]|nr:hydrogenase maturation nickel metallochaperone HypA [Cytophagaceae bacterium]MBK9509209.1 hydrogenase maturation nickel metallochaperone HypA [Cytophagaceae bacterium]
MHELSIVMSIVDIATKQTQQANAQEVEEIELVIGELSGVEMSSFDFAWTQGIRNSVLENARREIIRPEGMARCIDCDAEFKIHQFFDPCPNCNSHFVSILQGKEMRVKSLVVK